MVFVWPGLPGRLSDRSCNPYEVLHARYCPCRCPGPGREFPDVRPGRAFFGLSSGDTEVKAENGVVTIPLADVSDGKVHFFTSEQNGKTIRFFAVKSPNGQLRAAFDACDVCYAEKKGYRADGDFVVCANCGRRFHLNMVGEVRGGCNPAPLAPSVSGDKLVLQASDLAAGAGFF